MYPKLQRKKTKYRSKKKKWEIKGRNMIISEFFMLSNKYKNEPKTICKNEPETLLLFNSDSIRYNETPIFYKFWNIYSMQVGNSLKNTPFFKKEWH